MAAAASYTRLYRPMSTVLHLRVSQQRAFALSTPNLGISERLYTKRHEWIAPDEARKVGVVGISKYAQEALGDVVYVELPEADKKLTRGETAGAVESVKAASDLYAPVSGRVTERNAEVEETPALINKSPYDKGWLFKLSIDDAAELDKLMDEAAYQKFRKDEHAD